MPYTPIQCSHYDYIEIACMHHYPLNIKLVSGEVIPNARAETTRIKNHAEFLVVTLDGNEQEIRLDKIDTLSILDKNAEFRTAKIAN